MGGVANTGAANRATLHVVHDSILQAVKATWGYDTLRPLQAEAMQAAIENRDCLTVLPTGGGKSLCYQVPPLVTGKVTVVLSPLIALMRDQVRALELNAYPAAALHSGLEPGEAQDVRARLRAGELRLVLAAPERAVTPGFQALLAELADSDRLGAIAVDEAHCISHWGHDFRPEYRRLAELRETCPGVGMQAFTATATPRVREDIARQLGLRDPVEHVGVFDRPNLTYRVVARNEPAKQIADAVRRHAATGDTAGAIVYCLSRKDTEELAGKLQGLGLDAHHYHAGMDADLRHTIEQRFLNESLDVVVATVAFGMGIDRSNVRLVVHATVPKSIEAYQQETGRAGRDGLPAECLLLDAPSDANRWEQLIQRSARESGADAEATNAQIALVRQMRRFVASMHCRHRHLSEHFGQAYEPPADAAAGCGACDVCLGETEPVADGTRVAQILLSAVARTGQRFGAAHIADVVRGADTQRVRELGHDTLSVHGLLRSHPKAELVAYLDQLVACNALERTGEPYETLQFAEDGVAVMKAETEVRLMRPLGARSSRRERKRAAAVDPRPLAPEERALFEAMRGLRKSIAGENQVPPYVVFSDATLRELARAKPGSPDAMLEVKGIGRAKLESFGEAFLQLIAEHSEA